VIQAPIIKEKLMPFDELSEKYFGAIAKDYEAHRRGAKWRYEQEAAEELLSGTPVGKRVLDVPVGSGRLIPILAAQGLEIYGLDISRDMLAEAQAKAARIGAAVSLKEGDIRELPYDDATFYLVSCLRFLNWIKHENVREVLQELSRVSSDKLLVGVRYVTPSSEVKNSQTRWAWRLARMLRLPQIRARRWGIYLHRQSAIECLFEEAHLDIKKTRLIERRWDSTDYVFYLLQKRDRRAVH
jgi:ubiquinone/menaquinone biosynthesis C-methylase UbiE